MATTAKHPSLQQIELFAHLSPTALQTLHAISRTVDFDSGQIIMLEGDDNVPVCFVLNGIVRIFRTNADGREQTLIDLTPGVVFNLPTVFAQNHHSPASAAAVTAVQLLLISQAEFRQATYDNPEIAQAVLQNLSDRLRHFVGLTYNLSLRNVRSRLAHFLLLQSEKEHETPIHWTQEEIATHIGSVRGVVSRILRTFIQEGLIKMERHHIIILDPKALAAEAEF